MSSHLNIVEELDDMEGRALLFSPDTPILSPMSPTDSSPISEFWLDEPATGNSQEPFKPYNLSMELADRPPATAADPALAGYIELPSRPVSANSDQADQISSDAPILDAEIDDTDENFDDLRITDLTLDEIDTRIITLSDQLLVERLEYRQLREDFLEASNKWVIYIDGLRVKIWRLEAVIESLEGKYNHSLRDADIHEIGCEMVVRRHMKSKLLEQLSWAEEKWLALDEERLAYAESMVRKTEGEIEHLQRVREVVMLTEHDIEE
ncbi:hypothetical protein BR93DRAFT_970836 [Coniochaeta sp. PMI_546]|nr:hypothetical protein BR93DRAFT_970836 [Coniochaeta sp. PMI_546]